MYIVDANSGEEIVRTSEDRIAGASRLAASGNSVWGTITVDQDLQVSEFIIE